MLKAYGLPLTALSGLLLLVPVVLVTGCAKSSSGPVTVSPPAKHEHRPPHGGTPVELGEEVYHVELVLDAATGRLSAYLLDGEMEHFIRSAAPSFEMTALVNGEMKTLTLRAVANPATGETVGDTSAFETQADWLKTTKTFDGVIKSLAVRGTTFTDVDFNFPEGNDKD
jgi:hypothetical protein